MRAGVFDRRTQGDQRGILAIPRSRRLSGALFLDRCRLGMDRLERHHASRFLGTPATDRWLLRTMFDEVPLPLDWPVYVSHAEASAYARWAGKELPSEAEWHRAAYGTPQRRRARLSLGRAAPGCAAAAISISSAGIRCPRGRIPAGDSAFGVADLSETDGNGRARCSRRFPGFEPFSFYPGYSANFFDGKHYVMKGGSRAHSARACCGGRSATGSSRIIRMCTPSFRCVEH